MMRSFLRIAVVLVAAVVSCVPSALAVTGTAAPDIRKVKMLSTGPVDSLRAAHLNPKKVSNLYFANGQYLQGYETRCITAKYMFLNNAISADTDEYNALIASELHYFGPLRNGHSTTTCATVKKIVALEIQNRNLVQENTQLKKEKKDLQDINSGLNLKIQRLWYAIYALSALVVVLFAILVFKRRNNSTEIQNNNSGSDQGTRMYGDLHQRQDGIDDQQRDNLRGITSEHEEDQVMVASSSR